MFSVLKRIFKMVGEDKRKVYISMALQFVDTFLSFAPLGATLWYFQKYLDNDLTSEFPIVVFVALALSVIVRSYVRYYADKYQYSAIYVTMSDERIKIADYVKKINMGFFTDDNVGRVTTIVTNGLAFIEEHGMSAIITTITSLVNIILIAIMLCTLDLSVAALFMLTTAITSIVLFFYHKKSIITGIESNRANEELTSSVIEYVKNISVIKSFNLLGKHDRSTKAFKERHRADLGSEFVTIPFVLTAMIIMSLGTGVIIWRALSVQVDMPIYNVVILVIFALYLFRHLETITFKIAIFNIASDNLNQINSLYDEHILESFDDQKPEDYSISFDHVSFGYPDSHTKVLEDISFSVKEKTMTALVGLSGSGKSTLVNLIPRFYDIQQGEIKIGQVDVKKMTTNTLYSSISMVFQNVYLFKDTIYNNIAFGNEQATKEEVIEATKKAKCYDFIMALPNGFDTLVGEAGLTLSGGERQRVSIARAILKDAPIILLDEATASVDPDNEADIQDAINALVEDKTIIVIAHKLSCVKTADKILVLNDGKLIQEGTHDELLTHDGLYASLWNKRLNSKSWKISNS